MAITNGGNLARRARQHVQVVEQHCNMGRQGMAGRSAAMTSILHVFYTALSCLAIHPCRA